MTFFRHNIPKGNYKAKNIYFHPFYQKKRFGYDVMFTPSNFNVDSGQEVLHRLFGVSSGIFQRTLVEFLWRPNGADIEIYSYVRSKEQTNLSFFIRIPIHIVYTFIIKHHDDCFTFSAFADKNLFLGYYKVSIINKDIFGFETFLKINSKDGANCNQTFLMRKKF